VVLQPGGELCGAQRQLVGQVIADCAGEDSRVLVLELAAVDRRG
jgi:anti-anti-sigma regulatory factor